MSLSRTILERFVLTEKFYFYRPSTVSSDVSRVSTYLLSVHTWVLDLMIYSREVIFNYEPAAVSLLLLYNAHVRYQRSKVVVAMKSIIAVYDYTIIPRKIWATLNK